MSQYKQLYQEILKNEEFRENLLEDPAQALRDLNIRPSPEVLAAVCSIIEDVRQLQIELKAKSGEMQECVS